MFDLEKINHAAHKGCLVAVSDACNVTDAEAQSRLDGYRDDLAGRRMYNEAVCAGWAAIGRQPRSTEEALSWVQAEAYVVFHAWLSTKS